MVQRGPPVTVIRLDTHLSPERAAALRELTKTPGLTVTEAVRRAIATERLPGGPIIQSGEPQSSEPTDG
jgi:hypothetical protein